MTTYFYHYIDANGRRRLNWLRAESAAACCALLAGCGIYPVHMIGLRRPVFFKGRTPGNRQMAMLFRQLSVALASGVPLLEALHYMRREASGERQRAFIARLEQEVLAGHAFSEALRREKGVASLLAQWVAIGERQGRLAQVLEEVWQHLDNQERLRKRLQQQLLYPAVVLLAVLLVGAVLSLVVMPILARQFMSFETEVPVLMRIFLLAHDVLVDYGAWLLAALLLLTAIGFWWRTHHANNAVLQRAARRLVLTAPILNKYFVLRVYVPFARLFGQLLQSGVPVSEALEELRSYFSRALFAADIRDICEAMGKGSKLSDVIAQAAFVPELARQMLLNGERYGRLPQALLDSASYYETILFEELSLWIRFVEPLAIVLLGLLVLFMALGLFVPVLESYQSLLAQ